MNTHLKAAKQGNARAQHRLGFCYGQGKGVDMSSDSAVEWFKKAAEQGYVPAYESLGDCYKFGICGVNKEAEQAKLWYGKAMDAYKVEAEKGNAVAQYRLGHHYYLGNGVEKDYGKAVVWWSKSAEQGYAAAQGDLGLCYEKGCGVKKDLEKAEYWYRLAAENGNEEVIRERAKKGK
jgi:TPR repeat protein